jgi:hypothetical protein
MSFPICFQDNKGMVLSDDVGDVVGGVIGSLVGTLVDDVGDLDELGALDDLASLGAFDDSGFLGVLDDLGALGALDEVVGTFGDDGSKTGGSPITLFGLVLCLLNSKLSNSTEATAAVERITRRIAILGFRV